MKNYLLKLGLGAALVLPVSLLADESVPTVELVKPQAPVGAPAAAPSAVLDSDTPLEISSQPLTPKSQVQAARLSDLFRVIFAACRADINTLKAIKNPTPAQTKKLATKEKEMKDLVVLFDEAVNIAPVVVSLSIQFGAELPSRLLSLIPGVSKIKFGEPGLQYSAGVTLAVVKDELTSRPSLAIGISQIAGGNFTFGTRQHDKLRPRAGVTYLVPAVAVVVPLVEDLRATSIGDMQGVYWGGAGEISTPAGENGKVSRTLSFGLYAKQPVAFKPPEAAMVFLFHGLGGETSPPSGQLEALAFNIWVASDNSTFRLPVPFLGNNRTSPHANRSRLKEQVDNREKVEVMSSDDLAKQIAEIQAVLEKKHK